MKAAQFVGKPLFEINEVRDPECPARGLVIRVHAAAICGTDLKIMQGQDVKIEKGRVTSMEIPRITGHEFSGVVERVGAEVTGFAPGDRVAIGPTLPCLKCAMCARGRQEMCLNVKAIGYHRDGGFAELVRLDEDALAAGCVLKLPENVPLAAAALTEPLSCAVNCLEISPVVAGGSVLIMGAGPLGLIIGDLARCLGAGRVILADVAREQLARAGVAKADAVINLAAEDIGERIAELTAGLGVDLAITACSAPAAQQTALRVVAKRGTVNFFGGLPRGRSEVLLDTNLIHYNEITVVGTHGSAPRHMRRAVELQAGETMNLQTYIDRTFPLEEINAALKIAQGKGRLKIVITPHRG